MDDPSHPPVPPPKPVTTVTTVTRPVIEKVFKQFYNNPINKSYNSDDATKELLKLLDAAVVESSHAHPEGSLESDGPRLPPRERDNKKIIQEIKLREKAEHDLKIVTNELNNYANLINELNMEKQKLEQNLNVYKENNSRLGDQLEKKRKEYNELHKRNLELKDEASQYQSALGDARNYRLSDDDANNPIQLTKVINNMQDRINDFCKLKGGIDVNEQHLNSLLDSYKCIILEKGDKVLYKAALQRHIIETIITKTDEYLNTPKKDINERLQNKIKEKYLDLDILNSTNEYLEKLNHFIKSREGTDEVSIEAPKKIRQLVYAVLGDRIFGLNKDKKEHEFIQILKSEIVKRMNNFRTIKKDDKKKENEDMIADIVRDVIKMFNFRIKVLEPPGEIEWIPSDHKIDSTLMEIGSLEDDNHEDWVVNLCSFPLISVKAGNERKTLVPAKINAIKKKNRENRRISMNPPPR